MLVLISVKREPTGIPGLDEIIEGGFIRGDIILVAGHPGTGKTTMGLQFLYHGAVELKEPGVYISITEPISKIKRNAHRFGWDLDALEHKGLLKLVDMPLTEVPYLLAIESGQVHEINDIVYRVSRPIKEIGAERVVIDTISALLASTKSESDARLLLIRLYREIAEAGATALLLAEIPWGSKTFRVPGQEFVVDGVIIIESLMERNRIVRRLYIPKMRATNHSLDFYNLYITEEGVAISPMPASTGI